VKELLYTAVRRRSVLSLDSTLSSTLCLDFNTMLIDCWFIVVLLSSFFYHMANELKIKCRNISSATGNTQYRGRTQGNNNTASPSSYSVPDIKMHHAVVSFIII
jgi:hypothetical protein